MPKSKHHYPGASYYDWLKQPVSNRAQENARLLRLIRTSFIASHGIYCDPREFLVLREAGETCRKHRVARFMRDANLRALHGYRTRRLAVAKPPVLILKILQRQLTATRSDKAWATDVTYFLKRQGWLSLATQRSRAVTGRIIVAPAAVPRVGRVVAGGTSLEHRPSL